MFVTEDERAGCFTLIVFLLSCDCLDSVFFPRGALGWYVVTDGFSSSSGGS